MQPSLFNYIQQHLDEDGFYTETTLPDFIDNFKVLHLGQPDAMFYTADMPSDTEHASNVLAALRAYKDAPAPEKRRELYELLKKESIAEYCDPFIAAFDSEDMTDGLFDCARAMLYNARNRELLKFAILLFGLYGMRRIEEEDPELWYDLKLVAHCEEFTFIFLYACRVTNYISQKAVWELLGCTKGWGKVFAILDCQCPDDDHRLWLLKNGPDVDVEYPPLAVKLITATHLHKFLAQPVLDYECYKSAIAIIGNYIHMLLHYNPKAVRETYNLADIDLYSLLTRLLHHALYLCVEPEDMLDMITVATSLREMQEESCYYSLSVNQCQELIAACDKMVYSINWEPIIASRLLQDGHLNYMLADLAYELEIDIWQRIFDHWQQHPEEYMLLPYLLAYEGGNRSDRVLQQLTHILPLYAANMNALIVPLRYLIDHPGKGEAILCAALNSIHELHYSCACDALDAWGPDYLTPALREAVKNALKHSTDDFAKMRLIAILQGQKVDMEAVLRKLKEA